MNRLRSGYANGRYAVHHPVIRAALASQLLLLIVTAVALAYWWPAYREHQSLVTRIETQRRRAIDSLHTMDVARAYRAASANADALTRKLHASGGQADLVKSLEQLAARCHVRIVSQAYEEGKGKSEFLPLYLDTGLQADYPALRAFLARLSTLSVWVEVQEMTLERAREQPGVIKAHLRLLTYRKAATRKVTTDP